MSIVEILYIILGACLVVITVNIVWLANETIKLVKSLRQSTDDVAFMTKEVKEKVLVVTEALDRAGTAASSIIGFIEDAIEGIKEKRDQLASSVGLVTGVGEYFKKKKESRIKQKEDEQDTTEEESKSSSAQASLDEEENSKVKKSKPDKRSEKVEIKKPDKKKTKDKEEKNLESEVEVSNDEESKEKE